ncbi:UNVERIFIED_CONTAM: peptidyl-prolyl isomerase FKBP12, putative [Hammondia hammondi]|eukprot:XP_008882183.1 peptidyl-prolyl isomerase FKBP12, putative [Hammondia hammondi]
MQTRSASRAAAAAAAGVHGEASETESPRKGTRTVRRSKSTRQDVGTARQHTNSGEEANSGDADWYSENVQSTAVNSNARPTTRKRGGKNHPLSAAAEAVVDEEGTAKKTKSKRGACSSVCIFLLSLSFLLCLAVPLLSCFAPETLSAFPAVSKAVDKLPANLSSLFPHLSGKSTSSPAVVDSEDANQVEKSADSSEQKPATPDQPGSRAQKHNASPKADASSRSAIHTSQSTTPKQHSSNSKKMAPLAALQHQVIKPGSGSALQRGQSATVHATGSVLKPDGTTQKFWSTKDPGQQPFTWQAGIGQVIAGWDQGVLGMTVGETRRISIPANMGYGASGFPAWGIPPNADLQFEIELLRVQ